MAAYITAAIKSIVGGLLGWWVMVTMQIITPGVIHAVLAPSDGGGSPPMLSNQCMTLRSGKHPPAPYFETQMSSVQERAVWYAEGAARDAHIQHSNHCL